MTDRDSLTLVSVDLDEANAYVERHHRHSNPVLQHMWSLGAVADGEIVGVAIIEWPGARPLGDGWTLEVSRVCTTGYRNACSFLYGAAWRSIRSRGYLHAVTYTQDGETAASVRAAGWIVEAVKKGREWNTPTRPREAADWTVTDGLRWGIQTASYRRDLPPRPRIAPMPKISPDQLEIAA